MIKYIKERLFFISLFFFLLIPIIAIDTAGREPRNYTAIDRGIILLTSPVQTVVTWSADSLVSMYHHYINLGSTREENDRLILENRELLNALIDLQEAERENIRLRELLRFQRDFRLKTVAASVIAKDASTEFRVVRINRGSDSGILKDMAVLNNDGIVGRVLRVTANTADVVTILDQLSAIDAIVRRSRARGIVEGRTDSVCQLKFALRTDDIQPGDLLLSSGLGGIFPRGIPVGRVENVTRLPFGITQTIKVRPSVDFSKLEEVLVVQEFGTSPAHLNPATEDLISRLPPRRRKKTSSSSKTNNLSSRRTPSPSLTPSEVDRG